MQLTYGGHEHDDETGEHRDAVTDPETDRNPICRLRETINADN